MKTAGDSGAAVPVPVSLRVRPDLTSPHTFHTTLLFDLLGLDRIVILDHGAQFAGDMAFTLELVAFRKSFCGLRPAGYLTVRGPRAATSTKRAHATAYSSGRKRLSELMGLSSQATGSGRSIHAAVQGLSAACSWLRKNVLSVLMTSLVRRLIGFVQLNSRFVILGHCGLRRSGLMKVVHTVRTQLATTIHIETAMILHGR